MSYMNFQDHPRYQRMVQRLGRVAPHQRAILNTLSVDAQYADENTRRMLQGMRLEADKDYRDKSFALRKKRQDTSLDIREDLAGQERKENLAAGVIGLGQLGAETYFGKRREALNFRLFDRLLRFQKSKFGGK